MKDPVPSNKLTSRKFWMALLPTVASLAAAFVGVPYADGVTRAILSMGALVIAGFVSAGYLHVEGKVDVARAKGESDKAVARSQADSDLAILSATKPTASNSN